MLCDQRFIYAGNFLVCFDRCVDHKGGGGIDDEDDDEIDETAEDIAEDEEDFDLICDGHVAPNRTRRLPDVVIIGSKKGGTRALIEFLKLHPKAEFQFEKSGLSWQ